MKRKEEDKFIRLFKNLNQWGDLRRIELKGLSRDCMKWARCIQSEGIDENGYFQPVGDTMEGLEELYNFPSSRNDDLSDAEAYQADMVLVPFGDENAPSSYKDPQMDPFEVQRVHVDNSYEPGFGPSVSYNEEVDLDPYL